MEYENIFKCLPIKVVEKMKQILYKNSLIKSQLEEIRIRTNLPIILKIGKEEYIIEYRTSRDEIGETLQKICENSIYAYQSQISNGYITIHGGHRVGIVGSAVIKDNKIVNLNYISSLNFRISRQIFGCSTKLLDDIIDYKNNSIFNTLIISPPGLGKTTLLRDIVKQLSDGTEKLKGINISVIDERGEIGASYKGILQNDLGIRTDLLDDTPKSIRNKNGNKINGSKSNCCRRNRKYARF